MGRWSESQEGAERCPISTASGLVRAKGAPGLAWIDLFATARTGQMSGLDIGNGPDTGR